MTPEQFVMKHAAQPYDAAKRREYYLKTRELKGRRPGTGRSPPPTKGLKTGVISLQPVKKTSTGNAEEIRRRREEVANRIAALNVKLDRLRGILSSLDEQTGEGEKKSEEDKGKEKEKKKLTAAEKKEAAKEAKERRDKETKKSPVQAIADIQKKIEAVQEQIREKRIKIQQRAAKKSANESTASEKPKAKTNPRSSRKG